MTAGRRGLVTLGETMALFGAVEVSQAHRQQRFVLTMAVMYVALNLLIDVLYGLIDPRVRLEA